MIIIVPIILPQFVVGYLSPYPTVEMVTIVYQIASDAVLIFASGFDFFCPQDRQASEFQYKDTHQEQDDQRTSCPVFEQGISNLLRSNCAHQPVNTNEAEDP